MQPKLSNIRRNHVIKGQTATEVIYRSVVETCQLDSFILCFNSVASKLRVIDFSRV